MPAFGSIFRSAEKADMRRSVAEAKRHELATLSKSSCGSFGVQVAGPCELCHFESVRNRFYQYWFLTLSMLAMLGALVSMPLTATYALAMAGTQPTVSHHMTMADAKGEMPCQKPMKPCPDCPQKVCPEMGSCLVKCFQPLSAPVSETALFRDVVIGRVAPMPVAITSGSLIPPLLRPPSV